MLNPELREFPLAPILYCLARTDPRPMLVDDEQLYELLIYMTGLDRSELDPTQVIDFQILVVLCGFALLDQHPDLAEVPLPMVGLLDKHLYRQWLHEQLKLFGATRLVRSIEHEDLSHLRDRTYEVVTRILHRQ